MTAQSNQDNYTSNRKCTLISSKLVDEATAAAKAAREVAGQLTSDRKQIAILDFGSQLSHLIARRVREQNVFCELYSCLVSVELLKEVHVTGIILSGGPASVYADDAPHIDPAIWTWIEEEKIPVLGICYGMQEICSYFGGKVMASEKREYGKTLIQSIDNHGVNKGDLFYGIPATENLVWMSHGDKIVTLPPGFSPIASSENCPFAAIAGSVGDAPIYGLQFHPEYAHTKHGREILNNFCVGICQSPNDWVIGDLAGEIVKEVREKIGPTGHVIGAVSGGVDSSVAAVLLHRAIGDRFHAIMVDNGCLRKNEAALVVERLRIRENIDLRCVDASGKFLDALKGVEDPEQKRKTIGRLFIEVFQDEAEWVGKHIPEGHSVDFLLQGTLYPDVIESVSYKGPSATIKSHHNVGGLPASMHMKLIEPLRELFKDEVRQLGLMLGLEKESVYRHPFPGPGLAIRILGEVTKERCDTLRMADDIAIDEIRKNGLYDKIAQAFVVLLPVNSVGVQGDGRTYEKCCCIRAVTSDDYMSAGVFEFPYEVLLKISTRIINEVLGINRVVYDVSSKPPATIEWE